MGNRNDSKRDQGEAVKVARRVRENSGVIEAAALSKDEDAFLTTSEGWAQVRPRSQKAS